MPVGTFVRLPLSVNRDDRTRLNLRGIVNASTIIDFANPFTTSIKGINAVQTTTVGFTGSGGWTSTIQYAYEPFTDSSGAILYPSIVATSKSQTILFRFLLKSFPGGFGGSKYLLVNGIQGFPNSGYYIYLSSFFGSGTLYVSINKGPPDNFYSSATLLNISSSDLNKWFHFGIEIDSTGIETIVTFWRNGEKQSSVNIGFIMGQPSGGTSVLSNTNGFDTINAKVTDLVILDGLPFTDAQMSAFATAPFQ